MNVNERRPSAEDSLATDHSTSPVVLLVKVSAKSQIEPKSDWSEVTGHHRGFNSSVNAGTSVTLLEGQLSSEHTNLSGLPIKELYQFV
jgi:hypothetical protein